MKQYAFNTIWPWALVAFQSSLVVGIIIDPERNTLSLIICLGGLVIALAWAVQFTAERAAYRVLGQVLAVYDDDFEYDDEPEVPHA